MVLINMKPKATELWSGKIYSHDSESTYYATIAMSGPDSLWVKACALGKFFCSGNFWSRIDGKPEKLVISRQPITDRAAKYVEGHLCDGRSGI
jgi:hypothetical protein